jgi:hypothetical protein
MNAYCFIPRIKKIKDLSFSKTKTPHMIAVSNFIMMHLTGIEPVAHGLGKGFNAFCMSL